MPFPQNFLPEHPFDHGNLKGRDEQLLPWPRTETDVREDLAAYYAVISHMDQQIGRILQALEETGQRENTIIFFTSDHGLAMGSHGLRGKQNMYEHTVRVPMLVSAPGIPAAKQVTALVYLRDLYPTICQAAGVPIPSGVPARSFVPILTGEESSLYPHVFAHFRDVQRMIRTDRWKLIYYPHLDRSQLFDLESDPLEREDLSKDAAYEDILGQLWAELTDWRATVDDPTLKAAE
jgi:arylsulfatase A-like enzyme